MIIDVKHEIGSEVILKTIGVKGFITGITVRENDFLEYEVGYFLGDNYCTDRFSPYQLEGIKCQTVN